MSGKYDDIINLEHHISSKHKRMTIKERAAQFAPFSALTGYSDAIKETARITDEKIELDENQKKIINSKLQIIKNKIDLKPTISLVCFKQDKKKQGGSYITIKGTIKKIDIQNQKIIMDDNKKIDINDLIDIKINIIPNEEDY